MSATEKDCLWIIKNSRDHYNVLGVNKEAGNVEIKQKYKKMVHLFHPDKNKSSLAEEAFKTITNSYHILMNNEEREKFDNQNSKKKQYTYYPGCSNKQKDFTQHKTDYSYFFHTNHQQRKGNFKFQSDQKKKTNSFKDINKTNCKHSKYSYSNIFSHSHSNLHNSYYDDHMKKEKNVLFLEYLLYLVVFIIIFLFVFFFQKIINPNRGKNNYSFIENKNYPYKKFTHYNSITFYVNKDFDENYTINFEETDKKIEKNYLQYIYRKCVQNLNYITYLEFRKEMYSNNKRKEHIDEINEAIRKVDRSSCYEYAELKLKIN